MTTEQQLKNFKKKQFKIVCEYVFMTIIAVLTLMWGLNKIETIWYGFIMSVLLIFWLWLSFKTPTPKTTKAVSATDDSSVTDTYHNQGTVMLYFFLGLLTFMTITVTLTLLIIKEVLHADNFVVNTIAVIVNLIFLVTWCQNSFIYGVSGKKLVQLKFNGKLMQSARNLRPAVWGICKITPFTDYLNVDSTVYDEEIKLLLNEKTKPEDGQVVNVKTSQSSKGSPRVVKWKLEYKIADTYIFESTEDAEKRIPVIIFEELEKVLNKADKQTVEELNEFKSEIGKTVSDKIIESEAFKAIGLEFISFKLNSVERTAEEEKASSSGRARMITEEQAVLAETIKGEGAIKIGEKIVAFTKDDPLKMRALELAMIIAGDVTGTSLQTGSNTQVPPVGGKKAKKKESTPPSSNTNSDTAVRAAIFDIVNDNNNDDGGE